MEVYSKQRMKSGLPEEWQVADIGDLFSISAGRDFDPSRSRTDQSTDYPYPVYSNALTKDGLHAFCSYADYGSGSITVTARGTLGVANYRDHDFTAIGRVLVLKPRVRMDGRYYSHFINNRLSFAVESTGVPQLTAPQIAKYPVAFPPLPEQRAIADALSDVDALIERLGALIAKKRAIKTATMQRLLTGQQRLPGFDGEWTTKRLGEIGSTYGGLTGKTRKNFGTGSARYVPFLNIMNNVTIDLGQLEKVEVFEGESQNAIQKDDLFFNTSSETPEEVGMCSTLRAEVKNVYLNSFCFGFRLHDEAGVDNLFLTYFFRSKVGRELIYSLAQGATRYNLSKSNFIKLEIDFPSLEEQQVIATILSDMDAEIEALQARREKTQAIKQGMMQELLTGRTRLV